MLDATLSQTAAHWATWIILLSACIVFLRMILGPSVADRAVALDMLSILAVAFAGLRAVVTGLEAYLDVAAVVALVGFLATLAFARYIARQALKDAADRGEV